MLKSNINSTKHNKNFCNSNSFIHLCKHKNMKYQKFNNMKKLLTTLLALLITTSALSLNFKEARQHAWFLTDKMAYELNLTPYQFDQVYEVNLEYFLHVDTYNDIHGQYWEYRNIDLSYILHDWQYRLFSSIAYFYNPIHRKHSHWFFTVYDHYRKGYFYFHKPKTYKSYCGGRWHKRSPKAHSPYKGIQHRPAGGLRDQYHNSRPHGHAHHPEYGIPKRQNNDHPSNKNNVSPHGKNIKDKNSNNRPKTNTPHPSRPSNNRSTTPSTPSNRNNKAVKQNNNNNKGQRERNFGR